ncbi:MAG: 5'-nucleotidase C-terminal domain-containing protein, partial [Spirochaetales bacterium]|nr:5'-nucleotidase C-terminal domain-containing protein [Spirochaetales bacterium]
VLSHLGDIIEMKPYSSINVANNTDGIDVILDGHSHSVQPCLLTKNKSGKDVIISSTGTKFNNIGQLTITANGDISTKLIPSYKKKNQKVMDMITQIQKQLSEKLDVVVATSNVELSICNADGIRLVRIRETPIGNMCADAFRIIGRADIGLINGGGIRTGLKSGNITYKDIISVFPFGNKLTVKEVTGQQILDALEMSYRTIVPSIGENGYADGENGGFFQISGLRCTVDTSVASPVVFDNNGKMAGIIDAPRRVCDVSVLGEDGKYSPIDPSRTYTVSSIGFILNNAGDGNTAFNGGKTIIDGAIVDNDLLITYIQDVLYGDLAEKYSDVEGRITVK